MKSWVIGIFSLLAVNAALADDLDKVVNLAHAKKELNLSSSQVRMLRRNGFVVSKGNYYQLQDGYGDNIYKEIPSLVTADNVLQIVHVGYDSSLRQVESKHLIFSLRRMTAKLLGAAERRYSKSPSSASLRNVEYVAVASGLLGSKASLPAAARGKVEKELALITAHSGVAASPIFGYNVDYSQFIVRGHYTRTEILKHYFLATMWFGLVPIALEKRSGHTVTPLPDNVKSVRLLVADWQSSGAAKDWATVDRVVGGYVGVANNITPMTWLAAHGNLATLRKTKPAIVNKVYQTPNQAGDLQFRLMAQRAIPDSVAFNQLTGPQRYWPLPLDMAAVLGSARAVQLLDANPAASNPMGWPDYRAKRTKLARQWASWPRSVWTADIYHGELDILREFLKPLPRPAASFYRSKAYPDLQLSTTLAAWANLRHDSLLYGEQTSAEQGDGDEPKLMKGYVEPRPGMYRRASAWTKQLAGILSHEGFLDKDLKESLGNFSDLLAFLTKISDDELTGRKPSKAEYKRLWTIEEDLGGLTMTLVMQGINYNSMTADDADMAVVADVHSAEGQALEVGVGHADEIVAIVPVEGKLYLARGAVLSFYETKVPVSKRLTDHQWKAMAREGKLPPRPSFIKSYFVKKPTPR